MPIPVPLPIGSGSRITSILRRKSYGSQSRRGLEPLRIADQEHALVACFFCICKESRSNEAAMFCPRWLADAHPPCPADARLDGRNARAIRLPLPTADDRKRPWMGDIHTGGLLVHVERWRVVGVRPEPDRPRYATRLCTGLDLRIWDSHPAHAWHFPHAGRLEPDGHGTDQPAQGWRVGADRYH